MSEGSWVEMGFGLSGFVTILGETEVKTSEDKLQSLLRDQEGVPRLAHSLLQNCTIGWVHCCGFPHYPDAAHVEVDWQENTWLGTELS